MEKLNNLRGVCTAGSLKTTLQAHRELQPEPRRAAGARTVLHVPAGAGGSSPLRGRDGRAEGRVALEPCPTSCSGHHRPGWGHGVGVVVAFLQRIAAGHGEGFVGTEGNWRNFLRWEKERAAALPWLSGHAKHVTGVLIINIGSTGRGGSRWGAGVGWPRADGCRRFGAVVSGFIHLSSPQHRLRDPKICSQLLTPQDRMSTVPGASWGFICVPASFCKHAAHVPRAPPPAPGTAPHAGAESGFAQDAAPLRGVVMRAAQGEKKKQTGKLA